jgi:hypothetical protein
VLPSIILIGFHRNQKCPPPAAHFIEDEIAGDRHEPGGELCSWLVARGRFPDANKYLLPNVLCLGRVAEHSCRRTHHAMLMPRHQRFKCLEVASLDAKHKRNIVLLPFAVFEPARWL